MERKSSKTTKLPGGRATPTTCSEASLPRVLAAASMTLGQRRGELPGGRDPHFIGAMIIGGMRHVLAAALARDVPQRETADKLWVLTAGIMGVEA